MQFLIRLVLVLLAVVLFIPEPTRASIVFKPGQKAEYVPPGEEEISGNAAEIYQTAQSAEKENNLKRAIRAYKTLVKRHPKDALAPTALFRAAQLQEQTHQSLQQPIHISSWLKDMRATHILMKRSRGNFVLVRFI
jgi:DNA uptake lipoprotein